MPPRRIPSSLNKAPTKLPSLLDNPALKNVKVQPFSYKHEALMKFSKKLPRMASIGQSHSGKTHTALEILINGYDCWDIIYILTGELDDKYYQAMIANPRAFHVKQVIATNSPQEFDQLYREADPKPRKLALFDNLLTMGKLPESVTEVFLQGRHKNWGACIMSQTWFQMDKRMRSSIDIIILKRLGSDDDVLMILRAFGLPSSVLRLYKACTENIEDSFIIDLASAPALRYRHNFEPVTLCAS